jgi:hypothetical protein
MKILYYIYIYIMAGIVLPQTGVPPVLTDSNVVQGLSNNKLLTLLDMLKDMFRVSGTKVANIIIARSILKSFGVNAQPPVSGVIETLTSNMSIWESKYKKELTDFVESYAKDRGTFTTHRFFYKPNVALTTECRLPEICRFVSDAGYPPRSINPGVISLVGHGSTIDNGPRAHFVKNAHNQMILDGTLELFPSADQELDMSPIYVGMNHITLIGCKYKVDQDGISHTMINAVIYGQNVVINVLRNIFLPVAQNFVSATYSVNGGEPVNWVMGDEGDICAPNEYKNSRANENFGTVGGLQMQDSIRFLLKFLGDEALCITTFIADNDFTQKGQGRVAISTGDGMIRLRCLLMNIPFVKQFDGSAQTLQAASTDQKEKIKTCEFEHWCPVSDPRLIYELLVKRNYLKVKSHNDGIKQLLLSAIAVNQIGITSTVVYTCGRSITCYLNSLIETISHIQQLFDIVYNFLKILADKTVAQIQELQAGALAAQAAQAAQAEQAGAAGAAAALNNLVTSTAVATADGLIQIFQHLEINIQGVLSVFGEIIALSLDTNKNARGSDMEALFKVFKVNSFIERKNKQIVALKVSNLLESSKYISPPIPLTPIHKKQFVDFVFAVIKGNIKYPSQGGGGGGNIQRGGQKMFTCTTTTTTITIDTFQPNHIDIIPTELFDAQGNLIASQQHIIETQRAAAAAAAAYRAKDGRSSNVSIRVPSDDNVRLTNTYDYHQFRVNQKFVVGNHQGSKQELENICKEVGVSLFEVGHFWLRNLIEMFLNILLQRYGARLNTIPVLQIESLDVMTICEGNVENATNLIVTFLSCYYYEYLEKALPISGRNGSQCLLDDLYWDRPIERTGEDAYGHEVISLNGLTLKEHIESWLMVLLITQTIPEYEIMNEGGKTFFILNKDSTRYIINDEGTLITSIAKIVTVAGKTYYRYGQYLYDDESFKPDNRIKIGTFGSDFEFVKIGNMQYKLKGGSKRNAKSNKRSNKYSKMNRKTRKNRFSLLGKRRPTAKFQKTRTNKTQTAKLKHRRNQTRSIK